MAKNDHTPGPWSVEDNAIMADVGAHICTVSTADDFPCLDQDEETQAHVMDECAANARLIAAAPELLEALRQMIVNAEGDKKQYRDCYKKAIAAVAKAEGRA